jgi:hypothetical protein
MPAKKTQKTKLQLGKAKDKLKALHERELDRVTGGWFIIPTTVKPGCV